MDSKKRKAEESRAGEEVTIASVKKLVEPFTKEQLVSIVQEAAIRHPEFLEELKQLADKDPSHRKLFVRGLAPETTSEALHNVFSQYGELEEVVVVFDKKTRKNKGYAFVLFKHIDGAKQALKEPNKNVDGRLTTSQLASSGPVASDSSNIYARKIYVSNVPQELTEDALLAHFARYGEIQEGPLALNKQSGKTMRFAFFVYKSVESAKRAIEEPLKVIDGHKVYCKMAENPRLKLASSQSQALNLTTMQAPGLLGAASNVDVNSFLNPALNLGLNPGLAQSINPALLAQALHPGLNANSSLATLNPSFTSSLAHQLALAPSLGQSLDASLTPSLYSSLLNSAGSQGLGEAASQLSSSLGNSSYGLGIYGSQIGSQHTKLVGASSYGGLTSYVPTQASVLSDTGILPSPQPFQPKGSRAQTLPSYLTN